MNTATQDLRSSEVAGGTVMRTLLTVIIFAAVLTLSGLAEPTSTSSLPSAPIPTAVHSRPAHVFSAVDLSLAAGVVSVNALDWSSTEECLRRPVAQCREAQLPESLVRSKVGFGFYKAGITGLTLLGQWELTRHGHRRLAELAEAINIGMTLKVDVHNYQLDTTPAHPHLQFAPTAR